ncbi:MAG: UbiA prenyltransferase family protein [Candidatus Aquicultorales bacterium]
MFFKAIFDFSRGKQALLSVAQPALGAILALGHLPGTLVILIGIAAATTGFLAVFSLNDVLDYKVDKLALEKGIAETVGPDIDVTFLRHPLASGHVSLTAGYAWVGSLLAISGVLAYTLNPLCTLLLVACVALEIVYCSLRSITWTKALVSGVMVAIGGMAGWAAVAPLEPRAWPLFAFLFAWEVFGRNLPNDLADLEADRSVGIKTVATVFGNSVSAWTTLAGAVVTVLIFLLAPTAAFVAIGLLIGAWSMLAPAVRLVLNPTSAEASAYFNRASLYPALAFAAAVALIALDSIRW